MKKSLFLVLFLSYIFFSIGSNKTTSFNIYRNNYKGGRIERASEYLIKHSNDDRVNNYIDGNKKQMFVFSHDFSEQSKSIVDYRYIGKNVNNYIYFNCSDKSNLNSCELWRIIGVFEVEDELGNENFRIKIMRDNSIGKFSWDSNETNDYVNSSLSSYLNNDYYNGLSDSSINMIGMTKYYLGGINNLNNINEKDAYKFERSKNVYNNNSIDFVGYIGLLYSSDYLYTFSYGVDDNYINSNNSWMTKYSSSNYWTINHDNSNNSVYSISNSINENSSSNSFDVYPVLYLKYNTVITGGNGSLNNPYIVESMNDSDILNEYEMDFNGLDKENVNVGDTSKILSYSIIIISSLLVVGGIILIARNYLKSRKERNIK